MLLYMYIAPGQGQTTPLGTNVDVNRKSLSLCPFVASCNTISLKYDFKNILNDFIHVYSHRAGTDNPLGTKFDVNRNSLSLCPFVVNLKNSLWILILYTFLMILYMYIAPGQGRKPLGTNFWCQQKALITSMVFYVRFFPHVYSPRQGQTTHWGQNFITTERPFLYAHMLQVSKWSLRNLILYTFLMILYMYIAPGQGRKLLGDKLLMSTKSPYHFDHLLQVSNKSLWILI